MLQTYHRGYPEFGIKNNNTTTGDELLLRCLNSYHQTSMITDASERINHKRTAMNWELLSLSRSLFLYPSSPTFAVVMQFIFLALLRSSVLQESLDSGWFSPNLACVDCVTLKSSGEDDLATYMPAGKHLITALCAPPRCLENRVRIIRRARTYRAPL